MGNDTHLVDSGEKEKLKGKIEVLNVSTDVFLDFLKEHLPEDKHHDLVSTLEKSLNQKQPSLPDDALLETFFEDKKKSILRKVRNLYSS